VVTEKKVVLIVVMVEKRVELTYDDDDDVYLDKLQTRGVKKSIVYKRPAN